MTLTYLHSPFHAFSINQHLQLFNLLNGSITDKVHGYAVFITAGRAFVVVIGINQVTFRTVHGNVILDGRHNATPFRTIPWTYSADFEAMDLLIFPLV
jgi:hypothetical protein